MKDIKTLYIAQLNSITVKVKSNYDKVLECYKEALDKKVDLMILARFALSGYVTESSTLIGEYSDNCSQYVKLLSKETYGKNTAIILGSIAVEGNELHEVIYLIENGLTRKLLSFNINNSSPNAIKFTFRKREIALIITNNNLENLPIEENQAEVLLLMGIIPYHLKKQQIIPQNFSREKLVIYINLVGLINDNIFDGESYVAHYNRKVMLSLFTEDKKLISLSSLQNSHTSSINTISLDYKALMFALKEYTQKNNFQSIVLGLSGGIDSAIVATIAADTLGAENVSSFMLPTRYTSKESLIDADQLTKQLGIAYNKIDIDPIFCHIEKTLHGVFNNHNEDITTQNIQSRIRGLILMAISNKNKLLLLATGNKSEFSVGYATIYGDMCGGFAPIKDIYKTKVYALSNWRNENIPENSLCQKLKVIPERIITKAPSAELRYNQKDQDTLPDYEILDKILDLLMVQHQSVNTVISKGYDPNIVHHIVDLIIKSEFKRKQSPIGPKI